MRRVRYDVVKDPDLGVIVRATNTHTGETGISDGRRLDYSDRSFLWLLFALVGSHCRTLLFEIQQRLK